MNSNERTPRATIAAALLAGAVAAADVLGYAAPADAAGPAPAAVTSPAVVSRPPGFSTKVKIPSGAVLDVSSADCSRRSFGLGQPQTQLGPIGASDSQTIIAVPIGAGGIGPIASATSQAQIAEVCDGQRR